MNKKPLKLHEINFGLIGSTNNLSGLKADIANVCKDVTNAACINEICIMDIVKTFHSHGFEVVQFEEKDNTIRRTEDTMTLKQGIKHLQSIKDEVDKKIKNKI